MHYEFKRKNSAAEVFHNINIIYNNKTVTERTVQRWYQKFSSGDESLENQSRGRPEINVENEVLKTIIEENASQTSCDLAKRIGVSHTAILRHLHDIRKVWKMEKWVKTILQVIIMNLF